MANKKKNSPFGDIFNQARKSEDKKTQERLIKGETVNAEQYTVKEIPVEDIVFNRNNTVFNKNDTDEDIRILAASMKEQRDLRNPILVKKMQNGKYLLIGGERRTRAFQLHGWRRIPAIVYDNISDSDATILLFFDNLQSRPLTDEQRFLAFDELERRLKESQEKIKVKEINEKIAEALSVAERTVERLRKLRKHATEEDIELLREGKITYDEFKRRTNQLIANIEKQHSEIEQRKYIISQNVKEVRYVNSNNTVYYVDSTPEGKYCIHLIGSGIKPISIVTISCPLRNEKNKAQADLDTYAAANGWNEYTGDMSEFEKQVATTEPKENKTDKHTRIDTTSPEQESSDTDDNIHEDTSAQENPTNPSAPIDNNEINDEQIETQPEIESDNNIPEKNENKEDVEPIAAPEKEEHIEGQISDFVGINRTGQSIRGSLYTSNDRVFILHNVAFGEQIGDGKFNIRCIAEEVDKDSVQRYDI